ncbi:MAG TPA: CBS domain-containing protein [Anaerolineae bacterium]|nr:CBS domain-containing protein [Anaerolineae bacterium]
MFVRDYMTRHPVMVESTMSTVEAQGIMAETRTRHVPVVGDGKRLSGLLTRDRFSIPPTRLTSLNVWEITRFLSNMRVEDIMVKSRDVVTTGPDATIEEAARLMASHKIGCLPVLDHDGVVIGMLTDVDMLDQLADLLGAKAEGVRVTVRVPDRKGEFAKITAAIAERNWGIYASGGVPTPRMPGYWDIVLKVRDVEAEELVPVLEAIEGQQVIDVRKM